MSAGALGPSIRLATALAALLGTPEWEAALRAGAGALARP